jgi:hypothetical protein
MWKSEGAPHVGTPKPRTMELLEAVTFLGTVTNAIIADQQPCSWHLSIMQCCSAVTQRRHSKKHCYNVLHACS